MMACGGASERLYGGNHFQNVYTGVSQTFVGKFIFFSELIQKVKHSYILDSIHIK